MYPVLCTVCIQACKEDVLMSGWWVMEGEGTIGWGRLVKDKALGHESRIERRYTVEALDKTFT